LNCTWRERKVTQKESTRAEAIIKENESKCGWLKCNMHCFNVLASMRQQQITIISSSVLYYIVFPSASAVAPNWIKFWFHYFQNNFYDRKIVIKMSWLASMRLSQSQSMEYNQPRTYQKSDDFYFFFLPPPFFRRSLFVPQARHYSLSARIDTFSQSVECSLGAVTPSKLAHLIHFMAVPLTWNEVH
jgi:hypothetical protein